MLKQPSNPRRQALLAVFILLGGFLVAATLGGFFPDFLARSDFLVFRPTDTLGAPVAWRLYFHQFGRLFEGIYWAYVYQLWGYSPAGLHLSSFLLNLIASLLATAAMTRLAQRFRLPILTTGLLLGLSFFFSPVLITWGFALNGDNSRLAMVFFFTALLLLQQWAASGLQLRYLLLGLLAFFGGLFTYENIAFTFPVALLLAWPLVESEDAFELSRSRRIFMAVGVLSLFFVLVPYSLYSAMRANEGGMAGHPAINIQAGSNWLQELLAAPGTVAKWLAAIGEPLQEAYPWPGRWFQGLALAAVLLASLGAVRLARQKQTRNGDDRRRVLAVYAAGLAMIPLGLLAYALAREGLLIRYYSAAVYGLPILLLAVAAAARRPLERWLVYAVWVALIVLGAVQFFSVSANERALKEYPTRKDYLGLLEAVPQVKDNTVFVMVDFQFDYEGYCTESLMMLYHAKDVYCLYLSSSDPNIEAVRIADRVTSTKGGKGYEGTYILLAKSGEHSFKVLPSIGPEDGLQITWETTKPLFTNYNLLRAEPLPEPTRMQKYLLGSE